MRNEPTLRDLLQRHIRGKVVTRADIEDVKRRARCRRDAEAHIRLIYKRGEPNL